ncbi:ATP-dependent helicase [Acidithiobacillus caldus]|uniref:DNA 3'-5' helicase n=1 Tax=Acidithiobacillus caldus TaxID=33059 RepID=A0A1E7YNQ9_9PROT|nr:3'-5' exonuclease [Acidithiobacillus caldus]OFC35553.1 hypothetical protein BAE29_15490 [Acidithiobacillus caldus]OFC36402.1 hypothetical protein BAE27_06390 [Acidithiobacillus caldus]OFC40467.1 hypothetical protein BAE28_00210 [Acidithiobacillus caldus]
MIARRAIAPLHHPLNRFAVTGGALRRVLVDLLTDSGRAVPTFVVGDDDQSIYSWRGSDAHIFRIFLDRYKNANLVRLEQNYRCSRAILDAANAVIAQNENRIEKTLFTENADGDAIRLSDYRDAEAEADAVAAEIGHCIAQGESPGQIAILYRKNAFSRLLEHALLRQHIPYRIYGGTAFYSRKEIKDALAYLRLVHDRSDDEAFVRAVAVPPKGMGTKSLDALAAVAKEQSLSLYEAAQQTQPSQKLRDFLTQIASWTQRYRESGLGDLVRTVVQESGLRDYYIAKEKEKGEERAENLEELQTAACIFHHEYRMGETGNRSLAHKPGDPLSEFLTEAVLDADGAAAASDNTPTVQLMSVHKAKGLEFDRVFVVALEAGEFPSAKAAETPDGLEEERRLFYVAMTRARKHLHLSFAHYRLRFGGDSLGGRTEPSRFLDEIPEQLLDSECLQDGRAMSARQRRGRVAHDLSHEVDVW